MTRLFTSIIIIIAVFGALTAGASPARIQVDTALRHALTSAINEPGAKIRIKSWRVSDKKAFARAAKVESLRLVNTKRPYGHVTAVAQLTTRNGQSEQIFVLAKVLVTVPVWVVKRRIGRGAPLNEFNVAVESRSLVGLSRNVLRATAPLTGRLAARALAAGAVLTRTATTTPLLVYRGDSVNVSVRVGSVVVRALGKALTAGRLKDRVRVRLASANQVVTGIVHGRGQVVVHP